MPEKKRIRDERYVPNKMDLGRLIRIFIEFATGFNFLRKYCLAATIFGTARCKFDDRVYKDARALGGRLAADGFAVITGGGPGVMEAANAGAQAAGGDSVGLNIELPEEQSENGYLTDSKEFHYFFSRKVMLSFASEVYIFFPGGFGTLDEFFEIVTLIQTGKVQKSIPVILIGKEYWTPLLTWIEDTLYANGAIDKGDMQLYHLVDSVDEAHTVIHTLLDVEKLKAC